MSRSCDDGHCVTCSDEGVQMRVVAIEAGGIAHCRDDEGSRSEVMTDLVGPVAPGERLLVHAGVALARVEEAA
jgi:hydrogenase maturation factor